MFGKPFVQNARMRKLALLTFLALTSCATVQRSSPLESKIDALMHDYASTAGPGASVMVLKKGEVVFRKGYGLADLEAHHAANRATNFRLASCTKQFTAASILLLIERGALSLDDPITGPLPEMPDYAQKITIRHLLTHTSGLVDYEDVMPPDQKRQLLDADVLQLLAAQKATLFQPGTKYQYSNSGYSLLALIVERVSGKPFPMFLHDNIFSPLLMNTTLAYVDGQSALAERAYGYSRRSQAPTNEGEGPSPSKHAAPPPAGPGEWVRTDQSLTSAVLGDGGIYSNVDDLALWLESLDESSLLKRSTLEMMFSPLVETGAPGVRYGFGWRIESHDGERMIWHTGETIGFRNAIVRFPDRRLSVVVLTNRNEGTPLKLATAIASLF